MTTVMPTRRWRGIVVVALAAAAFGILTARAGVVLLAVVGIAFAAYPRLTDPPELRLDIERTVDETTPTPGDEVIVSVRIRNRGHHTLADLRVVDGVPPMLAVRDESPRHGAILRPGGVAEFSYTVAATHGRHRFDPATVIARDIAGAYEVETTVAAETTIECLPDVPEVPLRRQTHQFVGDIATDTGGSGVEFHRTRDYQPGDSLSRIDWQRYARTGELSTIEFREERGAAVVLCLDAREPAYRAATRDEPHGVAVARTAAEQLLDALADTTDTVGLAALSDREFGWLSPGSGPEHRGRARQLLTSHPGFATYPPDTAIPDRWATQLTTLRSRLETATQVVLLSPLADAFAIEAALTLEAAGHAVTVITPDVSTTGTVGTALARTERANRVHSLRESGVRVVDWEPADPLGASLVAATEGWSY